MSVNEKSLLFLGAVGIALVYASRGNHSTAGEIIFLTGIMSVINAFFQLGKIRKK